MRLVEIPDDGIVSEYIWAGDSVVGIRRMDLSYLPTIEAEPVRHGRWEWRGGIPWCSNCGEMPPGYSYEGDVNTTPYCSNCGAKMDGDSHEG